MLACMIELLCEICVNGGVLLKQISLEDAYSYDYSIFSVLAFPQRWQEGAVYRMPEKGRPDNGFMLITDCECVMTYKGKEIRSYPGQLLYLPMGARYDAYFTKSRNSVGESAHITNYLLNFTLKTSDGEPLTFSENIRVFTPSDGQKLSIMLDNICKDSLNAAFSPSLLKAQAYGIITEISKQILEKSNSDGNSSVLSRAMDYIGEHCLSENVEISHLADIFHVSEATLRRIFVSGLGISPKDYINSLRLERAKLLLRNGGIEVCEVARLCGFDDPSYFSRFFKKHTGKTPGKFI
ncbi:MAG: helix-turn-helix transcriptional regulator [Ruminococcaceae bacterium]|nr:helix-turn-helix transcriptional regulator [Oscillospiraceae bacterium]